MLHQLSSLFICWHDICTGMVEGLKILSVQSNVVGIIPPPPMVDIGLTYGGWGGGAFRCFLWSLKFLDNF